MHGEFSEFMMIFTSEEKRRAKYHIQLVTERMKQLTPAGRRLVAAMLNAYNMNYGMPINRKEIAQMLGRPSGGLTPHDRNLLKKLCELRLIEGERYVLRTDDNYARGAEFRYSMDQDTAWVLNRSRSKARQRRKNKSA